MPDRSRSLFLADRSGLLILGILTLAFDWPSSFSFPPFFCCGALSLHLAFSHIFLGSALVIDPKGENAAVTARWRRVHLRQKVHIVDPFKLLTGAPPGLGLDPSRFPTHRLNPLMEINPNDIEAVEQVRNLAAALVMISPHANPFWDNASRVILAGIIAHVMTSPSINDNERHLGTVRDYATETNKRKMSELRGNMKIGGLADKAESMFRKSSDEAGGDIMTTLNVHMEWIDSLAMKEAMSASDFSFCGTQTHGLDRLPCDPA
jgi:type IV secretion system protein VirD4